MQVYHRNEQLAEIPLQDIDCAAFQQAQESVELPASRDTWISELQPDRNFGRDTIACFGYFGDGLRARTLLDFDLFSQIQRGDTIQSAFLVMTVRDFAGMNPGNLLVGWLHRDAAWLEYEVTAGNFVDSERGSWIPGLAPDDRGVYTYHITVMVQEIVNHGPPFYGMILSTIDHGGDPHLIAISTREGSSPALLIIEFSQLGVSSKAPLSTKFELQESYPNPFNSMTTINYSLPMASNVNLMVYDPSGREVARLVNRQTLAGLHTISWSADRVGAGLYFIRLESGKHVAVRRATLVR
jgi:hypothetical protein